MLIDRSQRIVSVIRNFLEKARREEQAALAGKIEEVSPRALLSDARLNQRVRDTFRTGETVEGGKVAYRAPGLPTRIYYCGLISVHAGASASGGALGQPGGVRA